MVQTLIVEFYDGDNKKNNLVCEKTKTGTLIWNTMRKLCNHITNEWVIETVVWIL